MPAKRYDELLNIIARTKPTSIVEIGTWRGTRAVELINEALKYNESVVYYGYDLFEDATDETDKKELNVKPHHTMESVTKYIQSRCPRAMVMLKKGNTNETLEYHQDNFVFIDGGHSVETIRSDYEKVKDCQTIVFDDYYLPHLQQIPNIEEYGCNKIVEEIGRPFKVYDYADPIIENGKRTGSVTIVEVL